MNTANYINRRQFLIAVALAVVIASTVAAVMAHAAEPAVRTRPAGVTGKPAAAGRTIRAAAISFVPVKFDRAGNADRLEKAFRSARQGGAKIAVAPEGVLEGYVVNEIIAGKAPLAAMKDVAVTMDDPVIRRFQNLARELEMCLVFGFAERVKDEVFNCAVFIDDAGRIRGSHHKMLFAEGSHPRTGGSTVWAIRAAHLTHPMAAAASSFATNAGTRN